MLTIIDTHAHLDEMEDVQSAIGDAADVGVAAIVAVGIDYSSNRKVLDISRRYDGLVYPALGLHPGQLGHMSQVEVELNFQQIEENIGKMVAIGEVGLDYHKKVRALADKDRQQSVLRKLLGLAVKYEKPIIIHSRYAWKNALILAMEAGVKEAVFHWYTGPSSVLRDIINQGYFVSATPAAEYHAEHRRAVREAPLLNLLLETDAPVTYGRESRYISMPGDARRALIAASQIKGLSEAVVAEQTTQNARRFFRILV